MIREHINATLTALCLLVLLAEVWILMAITN